MDASHERVETLSTPQQLADELKRCGQFDELRRALLNDFLASVAAPHTAMHGTDAQQPDKETLLARLESMLPSQLSTPAFKAAGRNHNAILLQTVEADGLLARTAEEVERGILGTLGTGSTAGASGTGLGSRIELALENVLRQSRGELVVEDTSDTLHSSVAEPSSNGGAAVKMEVDAVESETQGGATGDGPAEA